jgi:hypothetical protein
VRRPWANARLATSRVSLADITLVGVVAGYSNRSAGLETLLARLARSARQGWLGLRLASTVNNGLKGRRYNDKGVYLGQ